MLPQTYPEMMQFVSNHMSLQLENEGYSPLVGKIFALLLFATQPLSLQEMAEQLEVTKAAVSVHIRTMERNDLCSKLPTSSDRKNYYILSEDYNLAWVRSLQSKLSSSQQVVRAALDSSESLKDMSAMERESMEHFKRRCSDLLEIQQLMIAGLQQLYRDWEDAKGRS